VSANVSVMNPDGSKVVVGVLRQFTPGQSREHVPVYVLGELKVEDFLKPTRSEPPTK
jgi:hypothetical protein